MAPNATVPCFPLVEAVSNGALQGDNPIKFALPLLIIQITVVLLVTRTMAMLFKPFRQPRVLAEIIGGVLLGPSGFGRNHAYLHALFPKSSMTLLDTIATIGLLFFLFMVGLELDLKEIRKSGKTALIVALSGISIPFLGGIGVSKLLHESFSLKTELAPLVVFLGVPVSITAFPVLVRIMAERRVLGTKLGRMVIPAAAINDVCAWILLAIGVAISRPSKSPAIPVYVLLCGIGFVILMLTIVRRLMEWIADRVNGQVTVSEIYVCVTLVGVLVAAFTTDLIGIHPLFGAFVFGLIVPAEGNFAKMLVEKVEDFVTVLMLPLFFASSGLKTNLGSINSAKGLGFLVLLVFVAASGKIITSAVVGMFLKLNVREAFAFGFLMNTKGLVELIVLNIGLDLGVFDAQTFAILVLMCLILMFFTTPGLMALYKPARNPLPYVHRKLEGTNKKSDELRILACVHGTRSIPALLNLVEACRVSSNKRPIKLFPMHLIELTERTLSIITLSRTASKDGKTHAPTGDRDGILVAFEAYGRISKVSVKLLSVVSQLSDMHYDVCNLAAEKRATIIILPYNTYQKEDGTIEHTNNPAFKAVNQRVMQNAPCSVGILIDRGPWGSTQLSDTNTSHKIAVIFFGGPDDREALAFGCRLAEHRSVEVWVLRFTPKEGDGQINCVIDIDSALIDKVEGKRDEDCLAGVKPFTNTEAEDSWQSIHYEEHLYEDPIGAVVSMAKSSEFLMLMVGRQSISTEKNENSELGTLGDALANAGGEMKSSILVVQQHNSSFTHNEKHKDSTSTPTKEV